MSLPATARRKLLQAAGAALTLGVLPLARAQGRPEVNVYLSPGSRNVAGQNEHRRIGH